MRFKEVVGVVLFGLSASCCVARGSRVRMRTGTRAVEELRLGDEVLCVDPETGERVVARVCAIRSSRRECVELKAGGSTLRCTTDHPLYDPDARSFADAGDWALGRRSALLRVPDDDTAPLERVAVSVRAQIRLDEVFDLTVDHPLHTFVADGLLVHNKRFPTRCDATTVVSADVCEQESSCRPDETALEGGCRLPGGAFCRCVTPDGGITERRLGEFLPEAGLPMSVEDGSFDGGQDSGVRDGG